MSDSLRSFRRNAVHVRKALEVLQQPESGQVKVDAGYIQDAGMIERYKRLSIPVRRALHDTDRAAFAPALAALVASPPADSSTLDAARRAWQKLQQELDSTVVLGGSKVARRVILMAWLDAAAFYDQRDRDREYDHVMDQYGKAAEGLGAQLMEDTARAILLLDEAAAHALGEPVILPPPPKTPPPPPDPKESLWTRIKNSFGVFTNPKDVDS